MEPADDAAPTPERRTSRQGQACGRRWDDDQHQREMFEWAQNDLGKRLFQLRSDLGWSLERVGKGVQMKAETIADLENGRGDPKFSSITRLLAFYGFFTRVLPERCANVTTSTSRSRGANTAALTVP